MSKEELELKIDEHIENFSNLSEEITSDITQFIAENPDERILKKGDRLSYKIQNHLIYDAAFLAPWIEDMLNHKGFKERGNRTNKVRKAYGYLPFK